MDAIKVLDDFFRGLKGRYLILGDPRHGATSLELLAKYCIRKGMLINGAFGRLATHYVIIESLPEISPSIREEVDLLRNKGFAIIPGENNTTAPNAPTADWVDDYRVSVANTYWASLAKSLGDESDMVIICCGTSHVGASMKKDGTLQEAGLVNRLNPDAEGYSVTFDNETYTPEKDSPTWTYYPVRNIKPL